MNRLERLNFNMYKNQKGPNDVVIIDAVRTPLTKAKRGGFKDTAPEYLLAAAFKGLLERTKIDPKIVQDIAVGNTLQPGGGAMTARMAQFLAGFPQTTTIMAVNRLCSSGLEACATIAAKIVAGVIDIGIGSGVESMSCYDMNSTVAADKLSEAVFEHPQARNCLMGMGETSENVAEKFGVSKQKQNQMAFDSHQKAHKAQQSGQFKDQIIPVKTTVKDKQGKTTEVLVQEDDGIRKETTLQGLSKLKPAFKQGGTTTAGNSSQVTDGAAAVLLCRRSFAQKLGLPIAAKWTAYTVTGVPPEIMGIGPAVAIPAVLQKAGIRQELISVFEINEAFASQACYCVEKLGIDPSRVNPKGGAIALGHPLGCTGARQIATLIPELKRVHGRYGLISMCIGTGMGAAAIIEREGF